MSKRVFITLVSAVFVLSGCVFVGKPVVHGSGYVATETRPVSGFDAITMTTMGELRLTQGEKETLSIQADDNFLPYLTSEVRNGTLELGFSDEARYFSFLPRHTVVYTLTIKDLSRISVSGAASIEAASLQADDLEIKVSGAANVRIGDLEARSLRVELGGAGAMDLAGKVDKQTIIFSGIGSYDAADLESEVTTVSMNGSGLAVVWATDSLDVTISGLGGVNYYGRPQLSKDVAGFASVMALGDR